MREPRPKERFYLPDIIVVLGLVGVFFSAMAQTLVGVGLSGAAAGLGIVESVIVRRKATGRRAKGGNG